MSSPRHLIHQRKSKPVLIDTDTGVDDALAILLAMHSPEIRVEAITTVAGNVEVEKCTRNVRSVLRFAEAGYEPAIFQGSSKPLRLALVTAPEVHGKDGLGNTQSSSAAKRSDRRNHAVESIRLLCDRFANELTIVALGPLTNIALAVKRHPRSLRKVRRIVSMGGAFRVPGNTGPVAEFNYYVDPHAARTVLLSGLPLTVVPLDVTEQFLIQRSRLKQIVSKRGTKLARFIYRITGNYMEYHRKTLGVHGGYLHDPLATAIAIWPSLARTRQVHIDVECRSKLTRGMTVADFRSRGRAGDPSIVDNVDRRKFLDLFYDRVLAF